MEDIIFYGFAGIAVLAAISVVTAVNPVHSVFFLIVVFGMSAGVLLLVNVEFLAIVYVVVYVGAIAILFLFVVMMLNVRMAELSGSGAIYAPIGVLIGIGFLMEFYYIMTGDIASGQEVLKSLEEEGYTNWANIIHQVTNVEVLAEVLYTYYVYFFILAGVVLFVAMLGAIVLTLHHKVDVKRQEVFKQVGRSYSNAVLKVDILRNREVKVN